MLYEKIDSEYHIFAQSGEKDNDILRALVKASFELARPVGLGWLHFKEDTKMTDQDADQFIRNSENDTCVVSMDYVQGRQCKTVIFKIENGHYQLNTHAYEMDRGNPEEFLNLAKQFLGGKSTQGMTSTSMYSGDSLDTRLKQFGFQRIKNESDWDFRKRIFPEFFQKNSETALEFLMGSSAAEWDGICGLLCLDLIMRKPDRDALKKFADGFSCDPSQRNAG